MPFPYTKSSGWLYISWKGGQSTVMRPPRLVQTAVIAPTMQGFGLSL